MSSKLINNNYDFIFSSRYEEGAGSDDDTKLTYLGNKIFTLLGKIFFKLKITDILYTFVLGKTEKAKKLNLSSKDFRFCVELPIKAKKKLLKYINVGSDERKRLKGKKKVNEFRKYKMR